MPCYNPLVAYAYKRPGTHKFSKPIFHEPSFEQEFKVIQMGSKFEELRIPCGQCIGCRLEYSRQWAVRCMLEAQEFKYNHFITLTYDDMYLPSGSKDRPTLVPEHLKKFLHDLRQYFKRHFNEDNIRFFACGEYGSEQNTARPHFHILLFNCNLRDLKFFKVSKLGDPLYISATLDKLWNKGFVTIGELNFRTCAYTARYMLKKHKGNTASYYEENGIYPEFTRSSLKPGIARNYFEKNCLDVYGLDKLYVLGANGSALKIPPPSYFDKLYEGIDLEQLEKVKNNRMSIAKVSNDSQLSRTDLNEEAYLFVSESNKLTKIRSLQRQL